jgi:hypothetical protein
LSQLIELDITSDGLRKQGYILKKEGKTLALYFNGGSCVRSDILKFWNKTIDKFEDKLNEKLDNKMTISAVMDNVGDNFNKIMTPTEVIISRQEQQQANNSPIKMAPKATRSNNNNCSMEEWQTTLKTKYEGLKKITEEYTPGLWLPLEFTITMKCILNIRNITLPVIGVILGPPSSWKSVAVNMCKGARDTFAVDHFTPKSFVSHNSNLNEEQLQEIDLLPKMKNKLFMVPELSPLFTSKEEDLENVIGMIVRIGDGEGYTNASGSKGVRGYEGSIMFCWLGAAVEIPYKIHKMLSRLGPKLYFFRMPMSSAKDEDRILKAIQNDDFKERIRAVKMALFDYLEYFESCPNMEVDPESGIPKIKWDSANPTQEEAQRYIIYLAELLAYLRGTVTTWETEGTQGLDYAYASRNVENPERAATQLHNLARAHALSQGRDCITINDDLPLIVKVVLSGAASIERVKVLNLLINGTKGQNYTATQIAEEIGTSVNTAKRTMAEFRALGLVEFTELGIEGEPLVQIRLKEGLDWFFSEDFRKLKGDYMPGDFKDDLIKKKGKRNEEQQKDREGDNNNNDDKNKNNNRIDEFTTNNKPEMGERV